MDKGCNAGGILWLLDLEAEYPSELRADFRSLYGISFEEVGESISWREAIHLTVVLLRDPRSWTQAKKNNWKYPVSNEWMILAESFDLTMRANSKKKPKPLPRPWPAPNADQIGKTKKHTRADVLRNLERMNRKES